MAPRSPTNRSDVIRKLRGANPPTRIALGSPNLKAMIALEGDVYRLRTTELDAEAFQAHMAAEREAGRHVLPEDADRFQRFGAVLVEGADVEAFCTALEAFDWPQDY
jgi:hypothetical protein